MSAFPQLSPLYRAAVFLAALLVPAVFPSLGAAQDDAPDFNEYARLTEEAAAAHDALDDATGTDLTTLREYAELKDRAVIEWLDRFIETDTFRALSADQQELVFRDRFRAEYNISAVLINLNRCEEASERIAALLERPVDDELRPRLAENLARAQECIVAPPTTGTFRLLCVPQEATLTLDGELQPSAQGEHEVTLGSHELLFSAEGYQDLSLTVQIDEATVPLDLGLVQLTRTPEVVTVVAPIAPPPEASSDTGTWVLWGVGLVSSGVGVGYLVWASNRESDVAGHEESGDLKDPEAEHAIVDDLNLVGWSGVALGGASIVTGTLLLLLSGEDPEDATQVWLGPTGVGFGLTF